MNEIEPVALASDAVWSVVADLALVDLSEIFEVIPMESGALLEVTPRLRLHCFFTPQPEGCHRS